MGLHERIDIGGVRAEALVAQGDEVALALAQCRNGGGIGREFPERRLVGIGDLLVEPGELVAVADDLFRLVRRLAVEGRSRVGIACRELRHQHRDRDKAGGSGMNVVEPSGGDHGQQRSIRAELVDLHFSRPCRFGWH